MACVFLWPLVPLLVIKYLVFSECSGLCWVLYRIGYKAKVGSYTECEIMLFSELRLQNKNIAYRVVGKPKSKNPHCERPFEWPLELIRSIYMITNSCRNSCELLQAKACSNSIASDFYILLTTNTQRGGFKD